MTKELSCRLIQPDDYTAMCKIILRFIYQEAQVRPMNEPSSDLERLFEHEKFLAYYVLEETETAMDEKKIIGGAGIQDCRYPATEIHPKTCELCRFYIDAEHRNANYGKFFLGGLIGFAREKGYERMLLETVPGKMQQAIMLYRKAGFFDTKNRPSNCWDKTGDKGHLFMELPLNRPIARL